MRVADIKRTVNCYEVFSPGSPIRVIMQRYQHHNTPADLRNRRRTHTHMLKRLVTCLRSWSGDVNYIDTVANGFRALG